MANCADTDNIGKNTQKTQDVTTCDTEILDSAAERCSEAVNSTAARKGFTNQWVFAKVMYDNHDICKDIASAALGRKIERIQMLDTESNEPTVSRRGGAL